MSPSVQIFCSNGLMIVTLHHSFQCNCNGCAQRILSGGVTFLLVEESAWFEHLTLDQMATRFETLNPCIEVSSDLLLTNIQECLSEGKWTRTVDKHSNRLNVSFLNESDELSLHWCLEAQEAPTQMVMTHLVSPLFLALIRSNDEEEALRKSLKRISQQQGLTCPATLLKKDYAPWSTLSNDRTPVENEPRDFKQLPKFMSIAACIKKFSDATNIICEKFVSVSGEEVSCNPLPDKATSPKMDEEKRRHDELQRKLARELEKSKAKRNKKIGILRK